MGNTERVLWTVFVYALFVLEIRNIYLERAAQNQEFEVIVNRLDENQRTAEAARVAAEVLRDAHARGLREKELKYRALKLSRDVLAFADEQRKSAPRLLNVSTWEADTNALIGYMQDTVLSYMERFAKPVGEMLGELRLVGLSDHILDVLARRPTNPLGVVSVGERIGALAEQLPDPK